MFKKIARRKSRYKYEESALKPNVELAIDDIADYQNIIKKEQDFGYKGLKTAFKGKSEVRLTVKREADNEEVVEGIISHYDDHFSQLVIIVDNSLRRLTFDQIVEVQLLEGGSQNEELSD